MLLNQRGGFPLFDHLADRSHNWRDRFFFVPVDALGPIDLESPPPSHWGLLTQLKTRTTPPLMSDLDGPQSRAHEVLIKVYRRGSVSARELVTNWSYDDQLQKYIRTDYTRDGPSKRAAGKKRSAAEMVFLTPSPPLSPLP